MKKKKEDKYSICVDIYTYEHMYTDKWWLNTGFSDKILYLTYFRLHVDTVYRKLWVYKSRIKNVCWVSWYVNIHFISLTKILNGGRIVLADKKKEIYSSVKGTMGRMVKRKPHHHFMHLCLENNEKLSLSSLSVEL